MRYVIKTSKTYHIERKNRDRSGKRLTLCGLEIYPEDRESSIYGHKPCKKCFKNK